jgi:hypothetical protein
MLNAHADDVQVRCRWRTHAAVQVLMTLTLMLNAAVYEVQAAAKLANAVLAPAGR